MARFAVLVGEADGGFREERGRAREYPGNGAA